MSIQLSPDERDYLKRLASRRMKPTRRQEAIALLRLAEGLPPERVADHAGIRTEEVTALAAGYAERGLPGIGLGGENAADDEPWLATIPAFRDEALFREYAEALKARRRSVGPEGGRRRDHPGSRRPEPPRGE